MIILAALAPADAAARCRSHRVGQTTYTTCEAKTECRSYRVAYTTCR